MRRELARSENSNCGILGQVAGRLARSLFRYGGGTHVLNLERGSRALHSADQRLFCVARLIVFFEKAVRAIDPGPFFCEYLTVRIAFARSAGPQTQMLEPTD